MKSSKEEVTVTKTPEKIRRACLLQGGLGVRVLEVASKSATAEVCQHFFLSRVRLSFIVNV